MFFPVSLIPAVSKSDKFRHAVYNEAIAEMQQSGDDPVCPLEFTPRREFFLSDTLGALASRKEFEQEAAEAAEEKRNPVAARSRRALRSPVQTVFVVTSRPEASAPRIIYWPCASAPGTFPS